MKRWRLRQVALLLVVALLLPLTGASEELIAESTTDIVPDTTDCTVEAEGIDSENTPPDEVTTLEPNTSEAEAPAIPASIQLGIKETYALDAPGATFKSSKPKIASVSAKGVVTGKKAGSAVITVTANGAEVGRVAVKVLAAPKKVTVSPSSLYLQEGTTQILKATLPKKTASQIKWTTSDPKIATVDASGIVTAIKAGKATITATTFNGKKATCAVTVQMGSLPESVSFDMKSISVGVKESVAITPRVDEGAEALFTWSTKNKKIAAVSKTGKITGKKTGSTKITVRTQNGKTATLSVKVLKAPSKVTLSAKALTLDVYGTQRLTATLPKKTASQIKWTSSDPKVAAVDESGVVTGLSRGTATITASTFNKKKATCAVTVTGNALPTPTPTATPEPTAEPTQEPSAEPTVGPSAGPTDLPESSLDDFTIIDGIVEKYIGKGGNVVIPSKDRYGKAVKEIGCSAFQGCVDLVSVTIPSSVISIQDGLWNVMDTYDHKLSGAFCRCTNLSQVTLPETLIYIGGSAFAQCESLTSIVIPDKVKYIGGCAFDGCSKLVDINIPSSIKKINAGTFYDCRSLDDIVFPNGITSIGHLAFARCSSLTSIVLPDSVTELSTGSVLGYTFEDCTSLTSVVLSKSLKKIMDGTFRGCSSLSYIYIPESVADIADYYTYYAFWGCPEDFSVETEYGSYAHKYFKGSKHPIVLAGSECEPFTVAYRGGTAGFDRYLETILATADAKTYNPELAHMLMVLSASAYNDVKSTSTAGKLLSPDDLPYIGAAYIHLGFQRITSYNYYDSPYAEAYGLHNSAFTLGEKTLAGGHRIVLVTVRGSWAPDGKLDTADWVSNIDVLHGADGLHQGFNTAAELAYNALKDFVGNLNDSNVTYVITGHSRGAAIANLVSKKLDDAGVDDSRVFDYNFACPDVARLNLSYNWESGHANMFNISYTADPVGVIPGVAGDLLGNLEVGTSWGKFGKSYYFTDEWDRPDEFDLSRLFADPSSHDPKLYVAMMKNRSASTFHSWSEVAAKRLQYFSATDVEDVIAKLVELISA